MVLSVMFQCWEVFRELILIDGGLTNKEPSGLAHITWFTKLFLFGPTSGFHLSPLDPIGTMAVIW